MLNTTSAHKLSEPPQPWCYNCADESEAKKKSCNYYRTKLLRKPCSNCVKSKWNHCMDTPQVFEQRTRSKAIEQSIAAGLMSKSPPKKVQPSPEHSPSKVFKKKSKPKLKSSTPPKFPNLLGASGREHSRSPTSPLSFVRDTATHTSPRAHEQAGSTSDLEDLHGPDTITISCPRYTSLQKESTPARPSSVRTSQDSGSIYSPTSSPDSPSDDLQLNVKNDLPLRNKNDLPLDNEEEDNPTLIYKDNWPDVSRQAFCRWLIISKWKPEDYECYWPGHSSGLGLLMNPETPVEHMLRHLGYSHTEPGPLTPAHITGQACRRFEDAFGSVELIFCRMQIQQLVTGEFWKKESESICCTDKQVLTETLLDILTEAASRKASRYSSSGLPVAGH
ncbi:uncharacterized protein LY89DRAFT_690679 [Mollisia scopiformis]|uniref:Uncharacterized protein n=1 Tax=Mollisia scopiformis TaxID=149040 RepID=A0A132B9W5_MOLSC|nr:uncharacterized protein LY89DRAFT_690679 [Mollisia scopiformis]KUJ09171.1 hypothetical protein LY89DRAFT_690679 [Mollisia scopiformis]